MDKVTNLEESLPTHFVMIYKIFYVYYLNKSNNSLKNIMWLKLYTDGLFNHHIISLRKIT